MTAPPVTAPSAIALPLSGAPGVRPAPVTSGRSPVSLPVLSAVATGATPLSAFHRALMRMGLGTYNLVRLSSVIPPGVGVGRAHGPLEVGGAWGDRLFCVYAEQRTSTPGEQVWAGVGWVQRRDGGGGLLVEHEGGSKGFVRDSVAASLADMVAEEEHEYTEPEMVVVGGHCEGTPVSALVVVPFVAVPWDGALQPV